MLDLALTQAEKLLHSRSASFIAPSSVGSCGRDAGTRSNAYLLPH